MRVGLVVFNDVDYGLDLANALDAIGVPVNLYLSELRVALYLSDRPEVVTSMCSGQLSENLYDLGLLPRRCKVRLFRFPRIRNPRSAALVYRIKRTIYEDGVDIAHLLMGPGELWTAILAWLLWNIPVTSTVIIPKPNVGESLPDFAILGINRLLAKASDVVIVNGANQVGLVQDLFSIPTDRVVHIPLGPRTTAMRWSQQRNAEEPGTVLFFGRAHPHKGLEYLVRAQPLISNQLPHARILIAAHGQELQRCRNMIEDGSKFEIHEGFVSGDVLANFFERASIVVLPYLSASTSGLLMTAYVFGKPVVATKVGSLPEYVQDGATGLLVPPGDPEQLADAIIRLLSEDTLRREMGENAIRWVQEDQERVALQTLEVYEKTIKIHCNERGT